ncbi:glycosyltransferase family 2 protein [Desulforhopalus vacuolatus]|uniref:glycosyltransferase family 2 protein n=1 Tax=Desulforhopalus vacuolatus TaxID=40414 RepID=UPI0019636593|nr:glycosyltransferase family 2 protein [Desulforhopalus vacuolatus]MBM9520177.1 glycosyltransferase family 2 protein [Desulforhopalus vacuolatus]
MKVSVIIVSYNTREILARCLQDLFDKSGEEEMEVFVVDNDSADDSAEMVAKKFPQIHLIVNRENCGFAAANNQAWERAGGEFILLLNPDAYIRQNAVRNVRKFLESHSDCGLCGGRLVNLDGDLDPSARRFPNAWYKLLTVSGISARLPGSTFFNRCNFGGFPHDHPIEVDWVPGTFTMYRRQLLEKIGFFDERFYIYYEETDLCLRAKRASWKVFFTPDAEVLHIGGACSKTRTDKEYDPAASQILIFRMRSEWLYFRKNYGLAAVLVNAGVEWCWHGLRYLVNCIPGKKNRKAKKISSVTIMKKIQISLRETQCGSVSPSTPW